MGYSENKKLQKLCHDFSDFEDSQFCYLGQDWRDEFYRDCYEWQDNLKNKNFKKFKKVVLEFGESQMNDFSTPCIIKKFFKNNEMDLNEISEEDYISLFIYIIYDFDIFGALSDKATTPGDFKFLLTLAIKDFVYYREWDIGEEILKLMYKYRDNPSKFLDVLFKKTIGL